MAGKAARSLRPPYVVPPKPTLPPADEAVIAAGRAIRYEQNFLGGRGVVLDIENRGPGVVVVRGRPAPRRGHGALPRGRRHAPLYARARRTGAAHHGVPRAQVLAAADTTAPGPGRVEGGCP